MITLFPIATVKNIREEIEDDHWGEIISMIELDPSFSEEALFQIESFSHAGIIFYFHLVDDNKIETGAGLPRKNKNWPRACHEGVFAARGSWSTSMGGRIDESILARRIHPSTC